MNAKLVALLAAVGVVAPVGAAPVIAVGEAWPSKVSRVGDRVEYTYDLAELKAGQGAPDVVAEHGAEIVSAFLKALPREAKVIARLGAASITLSAEPELERAALTPSFAATPSTPLAARSAFEAPAAQGQPPKVLPSVDLALWKARAVEDGALMAVELAAEAGKLGLPMGRHELWQKVFDKAIARAASEQGDPREGALTLAARLGAAHCLDVQNLPAHLKVPPDLAKRVAADVEALRAAGVRLIPQGPWLWTSELRCLYLRDRVLAEPLPLSRGGTAAMLTLLAIFDGDPKLAKGYEALAGLRAALYGVPAEDLWPKYRAAAEGEGLEGSLEDLGGFLGRLASQGIAPDAPRPPLAPDADSPIKRFLAGLTGSERSNAMDELALGLQDGRVLLRPTEKDPWDLFRAAARVPLLRPETDGGLKGALVVDAAYRARLVATFLALRGAHHEGRDEARPEEGPEESGHPSLRVRLRVPPVLEIEPLPAAYGQAVTSLKRLEAVLGATPKALALSGVSPDGGRRPGTLRTEIAQTRAWLRGLELIATGSAGAGAKAEAAGEDGAAIAAAKRLLAGWRSDADLARDARGLESAVSTAGGAVSYSGVFGIGRRELQVGFARPPEMQVVGHSGDSSPFVADASAPRKYLVPVLVTGSAVPARGSPGPARWGDLAAPDHARFRALCDREKRQRDAIEAALPDAFGSAAQ